MWWKRNMTFILLDNEKTYIFPSFHVRVNGQHFVNLAQASCSYSYKESSKRSVSLLQWMKRLVHVKPCQYKFFISFLFGKYRYCHTSCGRWWVMFLFRFVIGGLHCRYAGLTWSCASQRFQPPTTRDAVRRTPVRWNKATFDKNERNQRNRRNEDENNWWNHRLRWRQILNLGCPEYWIISPLAGIGWIG